MSTASESGQGGSSGRVSRIDLVLPLMFLILFVVLGLSIRYPTHALLLARSGALLNAAVLGFLLGLHWNQHTDSPDNDKSNIPSFLRPRAMLLGLSVLFPLIALGGGIASYSGSYKVADLTTGLGEMCALAAVEFVFAFIGRTVKRRFVPCV